MISKMGCGVSNAGCGVLHKNVQLEDVEMKLPSCRVIFSQQQLLKLNWKFSNLMESNIHTGDNKERQAACLGVVVERLIQRLVCSVGNLDPRFSSKFLIDLKPLKNNTQEPRKCQQYRYLVRLDLLSTPALYPEFFEPPIRITEGIDYKSLPQGFAKIRVHGEFLEQWAGFISPNGFLRRDKIQEKFLELLTRVAAQPSEPFSPAQVDESKHCGSPGKIVDPITLSHILKTPASHQVYFGSAECNESRFPDPRDFRIAIVEGSPETRLHISFLSPTAKSITSEDVEVLLILGIGVSGWPSGSDFPSRLPLDHVDVMLGYRAAQLDYFLVPKGPHNSVYCEDRASVWEIRTLATEMFLEHHYAPRSVVIRVYAILIHLLEILKARGVKTINKYLMKNLLLFELEHKKKTQHWTPNAISRRVISILEQLLISLKNQIVPSYIFPEKNILLQDDAFDDDYASDRDILEHFLKQLHNDEFKTEMENIVLNKDELENVLLKKWESVITSMLPPRSNRTKRLNVVHNSPVIISYTRQQMEYVALLIREMLNLKNIQRKAALRDGPNLQMDVKEESVDKEDFIYLLRIMFDQAKQKLLTTPVSSLHMKKIPSRKLLKLDQLLLSYDLSTAMLLDNIKRSKQAEYNFPDDLAIVTKIIECLYKAMDSDGKVLGPVLRPYLNQIFRGSHENCCFLFEWNKKADLSEFEAIGAFSKLVLSGSMSPLDGIVSSANNGWNWAVNCLQILKEVTEENSTRVIIGDKFDMTNSGVRLIFTPSPGRTLRYNVTLKKPSNTSSEKEDLNFETLNKKHGADSRYSTIKSFQDVFESTASFPDVKKNKDFSNTKGVKPSKNMKMKSEKQPLHVQLREGNPFTMASTETRRQGNHRGLGSIVQALISLQKLTILQEISQYLPEDERTRVLSDIKKLSKEVQRAAVENYKRKSFSFSGRRNLLVKQKSVNSFPARLISPKKISKVLPDSVTAYEPQMSGSYRSIDEFSVTREKEEIENEMEKRGKQLDEELQKAKEESLRWACRQLRKNSRPAVIGSSTVSTFPKAGFHRKGSPTFPKSINTPFYIKVSSYDWKFGAGRMQFSNTIKQ